MSLPPAVVDIVDENVPGLRSLGRVLSAHGYAVCMFTSTELYLQTLEEGTASCVVIALEPGSSVSGLALGRAVLAARRDIPVIFVAGVPDASMKAQALLMGCLAYLEEPVSSEQLIAVVRSSGARGRGPAWDGQALRCRPT